MLHVVPSLREWYESRRETLIVVCAYALSVRAPVRVAIVEDDDAIRVLIEDLLGGEGYLCLAGNSLETGLELLERQRPDLLILDIVLGGVASGWMLLDQIGRNPYTAAIPVIVCTADATALLTHEAVLRERGIRCLAKPFDVQDLLHVVAAATTSMSPPARASGPRLLGQTTPL